MVPLPGLKLGELFQHMVSRVFKREIRNWCNQKIDQLVVERNVHRNQPIVRVHKKILDVDSLDDPYEIFWFKFPEELYNCLRELKQQSPSSRLVRACHSWNSSKNVLLQ